MAGNTATTDGREQTSIDLQMLETPEFSSEPNPDVARAEVDSETVRISLQWAVPSASDFDIECSVEERRVNQFAHFESYRNAESKSTYSRSNATQIRILFRDHDTWYFGEPQTSHTVRDKANYTQSSLDPDDHLPTQVDGISSRQITHRSNPRDSFQKYRYKVTREFVERVDEAYVIEYDKKSESGLKGGYTRYKNATAYKLVESDK